MPITYYTYKDPFSSTLNHPDNVQLESTADWPKTFHYNSDNHRIQGVHPSAPVYTANQPAAQSWYYGSQVSYSNISPNGSNTYQQQPQGGYYYNGQCYQMPAAPSTNLFPPSSYYYQPSTKSYSHDWPIYSSPGNFSFYCVLPTSHAQYYWNTPPFHSGTNSYSCMNYLAPSGPAMFPIPQCAAAMTAQAATAAATNATLAAQPQSPNYFVGNPSDYATQQAMLAAYYGQVGVPKPLPTQLAPYKPADGQQFWCKELDGSWTLRTHTDIVMGEVSPGHWERHATSGYFYWVRSKR